MRTPSRAQRGSALVTTMVMVAVILGIVAALVLYANRERNRAIIVSRATSRYACAEAGLQLAKNYFGRNFQNWNTYLANPLNYNPIASSVNLTPADPYSAGLQLARPELFVNLDNDPALDVYIYVRDNQDELPPAVNVWTQDNDQNVVVGAICISPTLVPRTETGVASPFVLGAEALLSFNAAANSNASLGGGDGSGSFNN